MSFPGTNLDAEAVDRVRELTSIGAGHAANALAQMCGRICAMRVPTVRLLPAERIHAPYVAGEAGGNEHMGVFFDLEGGPGGTVALIFPSDVRDRLVEILLGDKTATAEQAESALRELGNILVSHVASSIADTMGTVVLPSIPTLVMNDAGSALASILRPRLGDQAVMRIETEIADREREIRGLLVYVPDPVGDPAETV